MHNNAITSNSSLGHELFSGTLAGGAGFCTCSDYYKFNYNWACGNVSSAEGGGITQLGFKLQGRWRRYKEGLIGEAQAPAFPLIRPEKGHSLGAFVFCAD